VQKNNKVEMALLAQLKKELAKPRLAKSAREKKKKDPATRRQPGQFNLSA
jgi:hypothetical protein